MIQINPDKIRALQLMPKEQRAILAHCQSIDRSLYAKIQCARNGILQLLEDEYAYFMERIYAEATSAIAPEVRSTLSKLYSRLTEDSAEQVLIEELEGCDFKSIEQVNEKLRQVMNKKNDTPDPEMGGLSPNQVARLIYLSMDDELFPLKFNIQLGLSDLKHSVFFKNARILLKALMEQSDRNTATTAGNLNRSFVKLVFDRLLIPDDQRRSILKWNKVINEQDVWALHLTRVVCQSGGLVHRRKNKFLVPKKHYVLFSDEKAGELYTLLFKAYFTEYNCAYGDRMPALICIQHTFPYAVYRLGEIAKKYQTIEELEREILLPGVLKEVTSAISSSYLKMEWILSRRILEPLEEFGLIECKRRHQMGYSEITTVKKTDLFDRFIRFEW